MTSKERMMRAVYREKPDRLPVTIHQWQEYHLREYMGGCDQLEAYLHTGLDASVTVFGARQMASPNWIVSTKTYAPDERGSIETRFTVETPERSLTFRRCQDSTTTFFTEYIAKNLDDVELMLRYWPEQSHDHAEVQKWYDRTGDKGIIRGFFCAFGQAGPWQDFVEMCGTQAAIYFAIDEPDRVHAILEKLTRMKVAFVHDHMAGAKYDLIEHGGGAGSSTVISPAMFREFCAPYDKRITDALHDIDLPVVYHTCGGMMAILDDIPGTGCDASETLSPPGMGGDIDVDDRPIVKSKLGSKMGLIGGLDQFNIMTEMQPADVRREVHALFETFGVGGGYICSASDHFFNTPVENLFALSQAGTECVY